MAISVGVAGRPVGSDAWSWGQLVAEQSIGSVVAWRGEGPPKLSDRER